MEEDEQEGGVDRIARIAVENAAYHFDKLYDYAIPPGMDLRPGMRVAVPFGRGRQRIGLVVETAGAPEDPAQPLKEVARAADGEPVLTPELLMLLRWLKETTFCTWFDALGVLLPAGYGQRVRRVYALRRGEDQESKSLTPEEERLTAILQGRRTPAGEEELTGVMGLERERLLSLLASLEEKGLVTGEEEIRRRVQDQQQLMVRLTEEWEGHRLTPKQKEAARLLSQAGPASVKEICYFAGVTKGVVDKLVASGTAEYYREETYRSPWGDGLPPREERMPLSPEQQRAADALYARWRKSDGGTALLYGVTGSGKTQVFLEVIDRVLSHGRRAIVLVPEISLTPQTIRRFQALYGRRVAVLHSGLSLSERLDEWKRVSRGLADVVVGTRSAVFAPVPDLGLIVIDEEQEHTYKSESAPRFDARDAARIRMKYNGGMTLLASATPSVESYYRAKRGEYMLAELSARYGAARLPDVTILDMGGQIQEAEGLSQRLCEEILLNLERGEQTILLMNRRGHSTQAVCMSCHTPAQCPHCSIALKYHAANGRLMCHYCGYSQPVPKACPVCGSEYIRYSGLGTQKVEEELKSRFPQARILRMDADTTMRKFSHERYLSDFGAGKYDIMVGTQMVAKGLDFPGVTLVGVLGLDQMLYSDDFRSYERVFSLITQVVGRSGRDKLPGRAFLQTYTPENPILTAAAAQRYDDFFREEIRSRRLHLYPPFCAFYCVGVTAQRQEDAQKTARRVLEELERRLREEHPGLPARLLGLSEGMILRVAGRYRYKVLLKTVRGAETRALLSGLLAHCGREAPKGVGIFVDPGYDCNF